MNSHTSLAAALLAAAVIAAGCSTPVDPAANLAPVETRTPGASDAATASSSTGGTTAATQPQSRVASVDLAAQGAGGAASAKRVVYFDFDSFVIRDDDKPTIDANARALVANKGRKITVEGHTDDRGGREYNLALGQKRADAVARSLELLGVSNGQVEAVSFGKERPATSGSDEQAWAQNRRAELKDR